MTIKRIGPRYIDSKIGTVLDVWFPRANKEIARNCLAQKVGVIKSDFVEVEITSVDDAPASIEDAYLRLHLLSECAVKPNEINLDGVFGLLTNVAWTSAGPVLPTELENLRELIAEEDHSFSINSVDKFPAMIDYVVPEGVRIAIGNRVRLGAHLASGTPVMH